jgi:hypothetical protein
MFRSSEKERHIDTVEVGGSSPSGAIGGGGKATWRLSNPAWAGLAESAYELGGRDLLILRSSITAPSIYNEVFPITVGYPSGPRGRLTNPLFVGSNPTPTFALK